MLLPYVPLFENSFAQVSKELSFCFLYPKKQVDKWLPVATYQAFIIITFHILKEAIALYMYQNTQLRACLFEVYNQTWHTPAQNSRDRNI